ncbi:MAG: hypothetical protein R2712_02210 [Vicinamibacterales bacterium]
MLEDDTPQAIENFEFVEARAEGPVTSPGTPSPSSTRERGAFAAQAPDARVFVLFMDRWHVSLGGSARSSDPVAAFLDQVVGPSDLVGLMTPDITPQNITLVRRGEGIDRVLRDVWSWGQRDRVNTEDPREDIIKGCYPDSGPTANIAKAMIERRREQTTLHALDSMVEYLDLLRDERKFVVLFSEGWVLFRPDERLAAPIQGMGMGDRALVGVGTDGRVSTDPYERGGGGTSNFASCERERVMLAYVDHQLRVRELAQRANRANVSFYPIDPRGLVVFDEPLGPFRPESVIQCPTRRTPRV